MRTFLKITALCLPLIGASPSFARVGWGVDLHFGAVPAPPREIICERPFAEAVWAPGFYNRIGYRYVWVPGRWNRPVRYREGWRDERFEHHDCDREHPYFGSDREHEHSRSKFRYREGRIR